MVDALKFGIKAVRAIKSSAKRGLLSVVNCTNILERTPIEGDVFNAGKKESRGYISRVCRKITNKLTEFTKKLIKWQEKLADNMSNPNNSFNVKETAEKLINHFKTTEQQEYTDILEKITKSVKHSPRELPEGEFSKFKYGQHTTSTKSAENIRETGFNPYLTGGGSWDLGRGAYFWPENELSSSTQTINAQFNGKMGYISRSDYGEISSQIGRVVKKYAHKNHLSRKDADILYNELYPQIIHKRLGFDGLYTKCYSRPWSWYLPSKNRAILAGKTPQLVIYNPDVIKMVAP